MSLGSTGWTKKSAKFAKFGSLSQVEIRSDSSSFTSLAVALQVHVAQAHI